MLFKESNRPAPITLLIALMMLIDPRSGLTPAELRLYRLHRRRQCTRKASEHIGEAPWAARCLHLNRNANRILCSKLTLSYLLSGSKIKSPITLAYVGVKAPLLPVPSFKNTKELVNFLKKAKYPIFIKPIGGSHGRGCVAIESIEENSLRLGNGEKIPITEAAEALQKRLGRRAIVQERLTAHSLLYPVCGTTCPTVRLMSSFDGNRVIVLAAIIKVPNSTAMVDNIHAASETKPVILAPINTASGSIGHWRRFNGRCSKPVMPPVALTTIPEWISFLEIPVTLHCLDRGSVLLGWDIAVTEAGPMLIEVNSLPGIRLWQLANGRGFRDDAGRRTLAQMELNAKRIRSSQRWNTSGLLGISIRKG